MSGYESDKSTSPAPLTPGLSDDHSMQLSACSPENRSQSPEPCPKRRRIYSSPEPRVNGDGNHIASAVSQPLHSSASTFVSRPPMRAWTIPATGSRSTMPTPGSPRSPRSVMTTPVSPRSFGEPREFLSLILSRGLMYNRARGQYPPTAMTLASQQFARVPTHPMLRIFDWRMRLGTWPKAARDEAGGEMDSYVTALKRTLSNTW